MVGVNSERLEIIWKISLASSCEGKTYPTANDNIKIKLNKIGLIVEEELKNTENIQHEKIN